MSLSTLSNNNFVNYLNKRGIGASVHFDPPLHKQKIYSKYRKKKPLYKFKTPGGTERSLWKVDNLKERYRSGKVGDVEVKKSLAQALNDFLEPIRQRRNYYQNHLKLIREALTEGCQYAATVGKETVAQVKEAMHISDYTK